MHILTSFHHALFEANRGNQMSEENKKDLRLSDDAIAVVRELIQLSILTGTNIVDHMRAIRLELVDGVVFPTQEYVDAYNAQIEELAKKAEELQAQMQAQQATDEDSVN